MIILNKNIGLFATISLLILLIIFRPGEVFFDVDNYIKMYSKAIDGYEVNSEYSFTFFSKISDFMGLSYLGMFLIYALVSICTKYAFLKSFIVRPTLAIALYGVSYFILYEFVQMRVGAALGVFLISLIFYNRGEVLKALLACLLATILHYSIILLVIFLFLSPIFFRARSKQFLGLSLAGVIYLIVTACAVCFFTLTLLFPDLEFRFINEIFDSVSYWILPSRIYEGYFSSNLTSVATFTLKTALSLVLTIISICLLLFDLVKKEWIYYFSSFMVVFSFWIYFFLGGVAAVAAGRLAGLCLLFIIVLLDGVINKNKAVGLFLYFLIFFIFSLNLLMRSSYFNL